jgi:hypothetical protein
MEERRAKNIESLQRKLASLGNPSIDVSLRWLDINFLL